MPSHCDIRTPREPHTPAKPAVLAYKVSKEDAYGCFHHEYAGQDSPDVYIIDLKMASNDSSVADPTDDLMLPAVFLSMKPEGQLVNRTLTLVLKSGQRVQWFLESRNLAGDLKVIYNNGQVHNSALSKAQTLTTEQKVIPDAFDQLWKTVSESERSYPMAYASVQLANVFSMTIPNKRSHRGKK